MQISPVYGGAPVLAMEGLGDPSAAVARQRARLLGVLRSLDDTQWNAPSRCEKWSVKDVVSHLVSVDQFWTVSVGAALAGKPTQLLASFDPVAVPEEIVSGMRALSPDNVLAQYDRNANHFIDALSRVTDWSALAEAPPGHLALNVMALHALWDAWVHERDIAIPLGLDTVEDAEEVTLSLQYAAALSPALYATARTGKRGTLAIEATDPDVVFTIDVAETVVVRPGACDGPCLAGRAVDLIEGLSHRAPLPHDLAADDQWFLAGLAEAFGVA
jgi:uncharacterized protein (TIGR03083 family)